MTFCRQLEQGTPQIPSTFRQSWSQVLMAVVPGLMVRLFSLCPSWRKGGSCLAQHLVLKSETAQRAINFVLGPVVRPSQLQFWACFHCRLRFHTEVNQNESNCMLPWDLLTNGGVHTGTKLDVWQSAVVLYFMLTGTRAFEASHLHLVVVHAYSSNPLLLRHDKRSHGLHRLLSYSRRQGLEYDAHHRPALTWAC